MIILHLEVLIVDVKIKSPEPGFTIVEVFVAISILIFCATALFISLYVGISLINDIRENITASSVIQQKIEDMRNTSFAGLPSYGDSPFVNMSLSELYDSSAKVNVEPYIDSNIVRVVVTVTWHSRLNTAKVNTKRAITLIARNGINSI